MDGAGVPVLGVLHQDDALTLGVALQHERTAPTRLRFGFAEAEPVGRAMNDS